jgi:hypothetical protein
MNKRPERGSRSTRRAGSLLAAPPAVLDDDLVAPCACYAPVIQGVMGGTEMPYASSGKWVMHAERKVLDKSAPLSD